MNAKLRLILIFLCIGLTSCDKPTPVRPTPPFNQTWIDAPLHGSTLPLSPYTIVFHAASPAGIELFEIQINAAMLGTVPPTSTGSGGSQYGTLFHGETAWTPNAPGTYLISVRAKSNGGPFGQSAQVQVTVVSDLQLLPVDPPAVISTPPTEGFPILTPPPTPTSSPTPTPTPGECIYTALANLFCRIGPGNSLYPAVDSLVPGQSSHVLGLSPDGFFAQIEGVNNLQACYVPLGERYGTLEGACDDLLTLIPPPLPPTETPRIVGCTQRQAGGDIICVYPCPDRAAPGETCIMP